MNQEQVNVGIEWLKSQGFVKNANAWTLGDIRITFAKRMRQPSMDVCVRDGVQRTQRFELIPAMQKHVEKCMEIRNEYMERFRTFCISVERLLFTHNIAMDIVVGPESKAKFLLHGIVMFGLEISVESFGRDRALEIDVWCPDFDTELENPEDIIGILNYACKKRRQHGTMISENNNIVTTEHPQIFMAVMLTNPCVAIDKRECVIREVCDVEDMQHLLDFEGKQRTQTMYTIRFANYVNLDPAEERPRKLARSRTIYEEDL